MTVRAVIFDLGGVVVGSPMGAFAQFEARYGLGENFINHMIVQNGAAGAWARLERGELAMGPAFFEAFDAELSAAGAPQIRTAELMAEVAAQSGVRPQMVAAIRTLRDKGFKTAALTNNWVSDAESSKAKLLRNEFDAYIESAVVGVHKPDPRIYQIACETLEIEPPQAVFLDDIGRNLKTARQLGMHTIKVRDPDAALEELGGLVGVALPPAPAPGG